MVGPVQTAESTARGVWVQRVDMDVEEEAAFYVHFGTVYNLAMTSRESSLFDRRAEKKIKA